LHNNSTLDSGEPSTITSEDLFYTPSTDEAGNYSFTHLASGTYVVRHLVPGLLSATPAAELVHTITIVAAEDRSGVNVAAVFRPNEIRGIMFDDVNGNHIRDVGEPTMSGVTIFIDLNRNEFPDPGEPTTVSGLDGSYAFTNLSPGKYVIRSILPAEREHTYPGTVGGILWPSGTSNPAIGNVNPTSITDSLVQGQSHRQNVSITLPNTGALTNLVDVFLLFDDTGSFVSNSPIVRAAFPTIMTQLQASLAGIDLGFGVGRFEEYGNFASEYATGRPFVLNQPIVAATTPGYQTAIQAGLNRTTPGYGGDQPETDIEALFQVVTGRGFDGNNNGSVLDSGPAGLASTQINPGTSGDVPPISSFMTNATNDSIIAPAPGSIGGAGFRAGALPIILLATDTGFAYQPKGETSIVGVSGLTLPLSSLTQTSRPTTPFNSGAGIQETITGLNALGALVIGLGTNPGATLDPRQQLESISKLTGATNQTTTTIANGTPDPIAPGDPFYFQIASGFASSVANGVVSAIQNAVTNVAVDIDVIASDPRVHVINHTGIIHGAGAGSTSTFDIEFIGDGAPRRFDLQFVRAGTNVVLGSIPVVLGTPIPGDGYEYEELQEGEIQIDDDFGSHLRPADVTPPTISSVIVSGSSWSPAFIDAVDGGGAGSGNGHGYSLAANTTLPNPGIDRIYVQFNEPVVGFTASNVKLLGSNLADYVSIASVSYDSGNRLGLIQLTSPNTITKDKVRVGVSDFVTDIALNKLDGDANASAGGVFDFRFNVLVGDFNNDGSVNGGDLPGFSGSFNKSIGNVAYSSRADWNSDGSVNGGDLPMFAASFNQSIPTAEPGALNFPLSPPPMIPDTEMAPLIDAYFSQLDEEDELALFDDGGLY